MKTIIQNILGYSREFWRHWVTLVVLFLGVNLANQLIFIPIFRLITTYVLQAGGIPFISSQNISFLFAHHPLVILSLLGELIVLLLVIYWQFAFLLLGLKMVSTQDFNWWELVKESWNRIKTVRLGSLPMMLLYFILVIPFADLVFRTPLLAKVKIPEFILDYMTRSGSLLTTLIIFYVVIGILGVRLILTLPLMIFQNQHTRIAMANSWRLTGKGKWWNYLKQLIVLAVITVILLTIIYALVYGLQLLLDLLPKQIAFVSAVINLTGMQALSGLGIIWSGIIGLQIVLAPLKELSSNNKAKKSGGRKWIAFSTLMILLAGVAVINNYYYLKVTVKRPITISHRGVSEENGVQNTIPAMQRTHKLKPTFVEIDVHETKDHQFIVMHDENLKKLTGVDKKPHDLTLHQLNQLTAHENGYYAKLVSLDQYMSAAEKLHQRLLIEVKTTPADSKKMLQRFNQQYGERIINNHDQVQSLDYRVVSGLNRLNPRLTVLYIQPYNLTYPRSMADGYAMEYSTLNFEFIQQAHRQHNLVYSWTVNESDLMKRLMYDEVDGLITDNLGELNTTINNYTKTRSYANKILNYILAISIGKQLEL